MKTISLIALIALLFGILSVVEAQGENENTANGPSTLICCSAVAALVLIMAGIVGIAQNNTKRDGYSYVPNPRYDNQSVYIKKIDDGTLKNEPDNRKDTGYW